MKHISFVLAVCFATALASCSSTRSGGDGIIDTEVNTYSRSYNLMDLNVDDQGIAYTIDVSTVEGRVKLDKLSLQDAKRLALEEADIKSNCARIISPKYSYLKKGKHVLRITVFGFPARYKNAEKPRIPDTNILIVK